MKACESYIIEGDHCADTLTECRNMTFEDDRGPLTQRYNEYIDSLYINSDNIIDYGGNFNYSDQSNFKVWIIILVCAFIR